MALSESLEIALAALRAHPMRSLLTMLGIIIGVSAVIVTVAVGAGAQRRIQDQIRTLGTDLLMVQPGAAQNRSVRLAAGTGHTLTIADAEAIEKQVPDVLVAAPSVRGVAQSVHGNRNWRSTVNGTTAGYFSARQWSVAKGRLFTAEDVTVAAKVALLGTSVAEGLFGNADPVGNVIRIDDVPFIVIGVLDAKGPSGSGVNQDDIIFVPISTAKLRLFGAADQVDPGSVNYILIKVANAAAMQFVTDEIRGLLRDRHRLSPRSPDDFRIWDPAAAMVAEHETTRTLSFLLAAIASVSLVVGGVSIMNIMLVSVTERTREIGLRLAIGARRRDIRRQFLTEAVTLSLLGGILGIVIGIGGAALVSAMAGWAVFVGPGAVAAAALSAAGVGIFFGYYPAVKASRLDPIQALRFE